MPATTIPSDNGAAAPAEGQGLSIAHGVVVKKHGGTLDFKTEIGKGTSLVICLPLEQKASAPKEVAA